MFVTYKRGYVGTHLAWAHVIPACVTTVKLTGSFTTVPISYGISRIYITRAVYCFVPSRMRNAIQYSFSRHHVAHTGSSRWVPSQH